MELTILLIAVTYLKLNFSQRQTDVFLSYKQLLLSSIFQLADPTCSQTTNCLKSFQIPKHFGMLNHYSLTLGQGQIYFSKYKYNFVSSRPDVYVKWPATLSICKISKNTLFYRTPLVAASVTLKKLQRLLRSVNYRYVQNI